MTIKRVIYIILALIWLAVVGNSSSKNSVQTQQAVQGSSTIVQETVIPTQVLEVNSQISKISTSTSTPIKTATPTHGIEAIHVSDSQQDSGLSNDNYYINSAGNQVHSPAYSDSVPEGASAQCGDGTYSFSQSRRGTCSHHGGVAQWLQ